MGEIADMMLDGTLCEQCGVYLGDSMIHPTLCSGCYNESFVDLKLEKESPGKVSCPKCGKRVKPAGLEMHIKAKHGESNV